MVKKIGLVFVFFAVLTGTGFSQNYDTDVFNTKKLHNSFDVFEFQNRNNQDSINNPFRMLSPMSISAGGAFAINLSVGFGLGSYIQGDVLGGTIGLLGEIIGLGLVIGGYVMAASVSITDTQYNETITGASVMVIGGSVMFLGASIFEYIRPWFFE
ncbi:MAG: P13 family porin [Spirochaetaceae bacterium]|jgi:hypothetical protein|nr:P13 family porin [Spirochaetaceae bacterium]